MFLSFSALDSAAASKACTTLPFRSSRRSLLRAICIHCALSLLLVAIYGPAASAQAPAPSAPWSQQKAQDWYARQPWLVGSNYVPADAVNQLEMWQSDTFNPKEVDWELGLAESAGMNTMRVFLHDLLWQQDRAGFTQRIDQFLSIAARHRIRPVFVLFDSCWDPHPQLGAQHRPIPGVHNSGWVQSPGADALSDPAQHQRLQAYVEGLISAFAQDPRILAWDLWNEPDNTNDAAYGNVELANKKALVLNLLPQVFAWSRNAHPTQPLTSGVWHGDWTSPETLSPIERVQIEQSDVITFHSYSWPEEFTSRIKQLSAYHRPIICTEFMARGAGSLFDTILPIAKQYHVGVINWGLVQGKSQTYLPWDSWQRPYVGIEPTVWFHDVFRHNGTPYRQSEIDLMRALTSPALADGKPATARR